MNLEIGNQKVMSKEYLTPMKFIIDKDCPPKHQLTSEGKFFLQKLAGCKLMLDKSLCFQINDLQRHTMLILSGKFLLAKSSPTGQIKKEKLLN